MASGQSSSSSRESFLEKKIQILDQRLTLVEKFIDLRFRVGRDKERYSEGEEDVIVKSSAKSEKKRPSRNSRRRDNDSDSSVEDSGDESRKSSRKMAEVASSKKQKPGPASAKRRKLEELAAKSKGVKDCVVSAKRIEFPKPNASSTPVTCSTSGRTRRTPKRFQEENFDSNQSTRTRSSARKRGREDGDDGESVVKVETSDTSREVCFENETGDYLIDDGPTSPIDNDDDGDEEEGGYFTFPGAASGTGGTQEREDNDSYSIEGDENDTNWNADDDVVEDNEGDELEDAPKKKPRTGPGRKAGSTETTPRKKRGSYNKKGRSDETRERRNRSRRYVKVGLTELPTDVIANADPTQKLCHLCNWHFKAEVFEAHLESHTKERHLKCPECGKSYFNQFILKKHMRVHEPEKYVKKCRQCDKPFLHSDKLLAHERYCVKKALEKNEHVNPELIEDLKKRTKTDTSWIDEAIEIGSKVAEDEAGVKKQCPYCKKNFKSSFYERHVKTHTRAKNWSCNMCEKSYHYKHDLVRHVAMEHITNPTCDMCEKTFDDRTEYKDHLTACRRNHRQNNKDSNLKIKDVTSLVDDNDDDDEEVTTGDVKLERIQIADANEEEEEDDGEENVESETVVAHDVILFDEDVVLSTTTNSPQKVTLGLVGSSEPEVTPSE